MTLTEAFQFFLERTARERALTTEVFRPNAETREAMQAGRRGEVYRTNSIRELIAELDAEGCEGSTIQPRFRRDLRRELKGRYRRVLMEELDLIVDLLRNDAPLPVRLQDHAKIDDLQDHRDLHIRPEPRTHLCQGVHGPLRLVRLGTQSELGFD